MLILHQRILADSPPHSTFQKRLLSLDRLFAFPLWNFLGGLGWGSRNKKGVQRFNLFHWWVGNLLSNLLKKRSCEVSVCDNEMLKICNTSRYYCDAMIQWYNGSDNLTNASICLIKRKIIKVKTQKKFMWCKTNAIPSVKKSVSDAIRIRQSKTMHAYTWQICLTFHILWALPPTVLV